MVSVAAGQRKWTYPAGPVRQVGGLRSIIGRQFHAPAGEQSTTSIIIPHAGVILAAGAFWPPGRVMAHPMPLALILGRLWREYSGIFYNR